MIFQILFFILAGVLGALLQFLPGYGEIPLLLPWGIDSILVYGVSLFKLVAIAIPPLSVVLNAFLYYVIFKIALLVLRLFIGHRAPEVN